MLGFSLEQILWYTLPFDMQAFALTRSRTVENKIGVY